MNRLEHPLTSEELMAYVDGELRGGEAAKASEHVKTCTECAEIVSDAKLVSARMAAWKVAEAPERMRATLPRARAGRVSWWTPRRVVVYGLGGGFAAVLLLLSVAVPSMLRSRAPASQSRDMAVTEPPQENTYSYSPLPSVQQAQQGQGQQAGQARPFSPVQPGPSGPMVIRTA